MKGSPSAPLHGFLRFAVLGLVRAPASEKPVDVAFVVGLRLRLRLRLRLIGRRVVDRLQQGGHAFITSHESSSDNFSASSGCFESKLLAQQSDGSAQRAHLLFEGLNALCDAKFPLHSHSGSRGWSSSSRHQLTFLQPAPRPLPNGSMSVRALQTRSTVDLLSLVVARISKRDHSSPIAFSATKMLTAA